MRQNGEYQYRIKSLCINNQKGQLFLYGMSLQRASTGRAKRKVPRNRTGHIGRILEMAGNTEFRWWRQD